MNLINKKIQKLTYGIEILNNQFKFLGVIQ